MKWTMLAALTLLLWVGGCKKKEPPPVTPPPPPPPAPTASLSANPNSVQRGQATQLTWRTEHATDVTIEGVGAVQPAGSRSVTPEQSTTYRLVAKGPGGTQEATARVTVTEPPPPPAPPRPTATEAELFAQNVRDVFFDYDRYDIRPDAQPTLATAARWLNQNPNIRFTIEGHCDERGSTEYNLALGDNRANAVKQALVAQGVSADRIRTISYGKEKPFCTESNEQCWQQNRRGHFVLQR
jgi:peptidoglycan-associated lipoprotein